MENNKKVIYFKKESKFKKKKKRPSKFYYLYYSSMGISIVVPIFIGLTLGIVLDSIFATRPTLTLVFLFFGVIGSFYNLYKIVRNGIRID